MLFRPRARDLDPDDLQIALLRAAVGDYGTEAATLLLTNAGHWLPELAAADLITVDYDDDPETPPTGQPAGIGWAQITWTDLDPAIRDGRIVGSAGQLRLLRAAASLADGTQWTGDVDVNHADAVAQVADKGGDAAVAVAVAVADQLEPVLQGGHHDTGDRLVSGVNCQPLGGVGVEQMFVQR